MKVARDALTTDAQALIPQAQGTSSGARSPSALSPSGKGMPKRNPMARAARARPRAAPPSATLCGLEDPGQEPEVGPADDDDPGRGEYDRWTAAGQASEALRRAGAETGEDQKAGEHHRDGVERMPEKDREALHERDLDEEEGEPEAREEHHDTPAWRCGCTQRTRGAEREQRQEDQERRRDGALHQSRDQDDEAPFHQGQTALRAKREQLGERRPLQAVEEERAVVGRGPERELVAGGEVFKVGAQNGGGGPIKLRLGEPVEAVGVALRDPRVPDQVERIVVRERSQPCDCTRVERSVSDDQRRGLPTANHDEPGCGIGDASLFERGPRGPKQLQRVARRQLEPAGDGEHAIRGKAIEEGSKRFDRIEQRFVERVHARRRRAEGIDQRDLNEVPLFGRTRGEAACVRHMHADILALPRGTRRVRQHVAHDGEHVRVQLYRIDRACAVVQRPQHFGPAAGAQHQHPRRTIEHVVRERGGLGLQIAQVGVGTGDRGGGATVGEEPDLRRRADGRHQAETRRMAERHGRALHRSEPAERAVALRHDSGVGCCEREAQPLVGRGMRAQPVIGECCGQGEPGGNRQQRATPRESSCPPPQQDNPTRGGTHHTHDPQRIGERQGVEQEDHAQRAQARTHQVHAVERTGAGGVRPEGQRQRQRRREERQRKHEIEGEEPGKLRAIPRNLQRVEGERLRERESQRRARTEAQRSAAEGPPEMPEERSLQHRHQTSRRAEAEQRDGDDHVGEVMPVHDRQQACEENFVAQHAGREQRHG